MSNPRSLDSFLRREGETSFWNLVAAIAEGWKLKGVFHILSSTVYRWRLARIPVSRIELGGMSPAIDAYTVTRFKRNPQAFADAWRRDARMRRAILRTGFAPHPERDHFPILLYEVGPGRFKVFDGMRRTLLALTRGARSMEAWVGHRANPRGKPLISANRCWFLSNVYERARRRDRTLERALIRIGREIIAEHRNGKEVLMERIAGWSHNPDVKRLFRKIER